MLAHRGAHVVLAVRDPAKGGRVAQEMSGLRGQVEVSRLDVSDLDSVRAFADRCGDRFHRVEALSEVPGGAMRVLDMKIPAVCAAIESGETPPLELYRSDISIDYQP